MSRVLVIDDDGALCRSLELQLAAHGHAVRCASCAEEGIRAVAQWAPCLVVLDLHMPDENGLSCLGRILQKQPQAHVIMLTGDHDRQKGIEALAAGAFGHLRKPFELTDLLTMIERAEAEPSGGVPCRGGGRGSPPWLGSRRREGVRLPEGGAPSGAGRGPGDGGAFGRAAVPAVHQAGGHAARPSGGRSGTSRSASPRPAEEAGDACPGARRLQRLAAAARALLWLSLGRRAPLAPGEPWPGARAPRPEATGSRWASQGPASRPATPSSDVVHAMRSPLSTITLNLDALARRVREDPLYAEMAEAAQGAARLLEAMLVDLDQDRRPLELRPEEVRFADLGRDALCLARSQAHRRGSTIVLEDATEGRPVRADRALLVGAVVRLLTNAVDGSPPGTVVTVSAGPEAKGSSYVAIRVRSRGQAGPAGHRGSDPWQDLGRVRRVAERHGGEADAEPVPGGGASFVIRIPWRGAA